MRFAAALLLLVSTGLADDTRTPVIVELFTSEGCSSCPPADEMLARLEGGQPVRNARIIALEEHVDYWNQLGWPDRFSNPLFRVRQNEFAQVFRIDNIYTPQMIVNGQTGFVGDDYGASQKAIGQAAAAEQAYSIRLQPDRNGRDSELTDLLVFVKNNRGGTPEPADVYLAITESRLSSNVLRGENSGRLLRHAPVVRSFGVIGSLEARRFKEVGLKSTLKFPADWRRENLRAVVFVQDRASHRITGAAVADLKELR